VGDGNDEDKSVVVEWKAPERMVLDTHCADTKVKEACGSKWDWDSCKDAIREAISDEPTCTIKLRLHFATDKPVKVHDGQFIVYLSKENWTVGKDQNADKISAFRITDANFATGCAKDKLQFVTGDELDKLTEHVATKKPEWDPTQLDKVDVDISRSFVQHYFGFKADGCKPTKTEFLPIVEIEVEVKQSGDKELGTHSSNMVNLVSIVGLFIAVFNAWF